MSSHTSTETTSVSPGNLVIISIDTVIKTVEKTVAVVEKKVAVVFMSSICFCSRMCTCMTYVDGSMCRKYTH